MSTVYGKECCARGFFSFPFVLKLTLLVQVRSSRRQSLRHQGDEKVRARPEEPGVSGDRRAQRDGHQQVGFLRHPVLLPTVDQQHLPRHGVPHRGRLEVLARCLRLLRRVDGQVLRRRNRAGSFLPS